MEHAHANMLSFLQACTLSVSSGSFLTDTFTLARAKDAHAIVFKLDVHMRLVQALKCKANAGLRWQLRSWPSSAACNTFCCCCHSNVTSCHLMKSSHKHIPPALIPLAGLKRMRH